MAETMTQMLPSFLQRVCRHIFMFLNELVTFCAVLDIFEIDICFWDELWDFEFLTLLFGILEYQGAYYKIEVVHALCLCS